MKCRGCRDDLLASSNKVLDLGKLAVIKFKSSPDEKDDYADLLLIECQNCHLVQLSNASQLTEFDYLNGINQSTNDALFDVVKDIESTIDLKRGDIVVDIGLNDGLLLSYYRHYVKTIGFEPPNNILEKYAHRSRVISVLRRIGILYIQKYRRLKSSQQLRCSTIWMTQTPFARMSTIFWTRMEYLSYR